MGRDAEATAEAKEVLRINPKFTIESYAKTLPYKDKADVAREVAALIKAGLPINLHSLSLINHRLPSSPL